MMRIEFLKRTLAATSQLSGWTPLSERRRDRTLSPYIRIVSYHVTDRRNTINLERHFQFFAERYQPATWINLTDHLEGHHTWNASKPGIIIAFDDGGMSNFTVARPLLRRFGLTGIFLIPTDWINLPPNEQPKYAERHQIMTAESEPDRGRAMTWDQIRRLEAEGDKIVSHTRTHHRFTAEDSEETFQQEIVESKRILEDRLQTEIDAFGWVGGETDVYQKKALEFIRLAPYRYLLSTVLGPNLSPTDPMMIRRTALVDDWPLDLVRLYLLPASDRRYQKKEAVIRSRLGFS